MPWNDRMATGNPTKVAAARVVNDARRTRRRLRDTRGHGRGAGADSRIAVGHVKSSSG